MNETFWWLLGGTVLLAIGLWLMLPRGAAGGRRWGILLVAIALADLAAQMPALEESIGDAMFYLLAALTVFAAVATVTSRNPVYSAIWFAMSLLATAGLFLFQGAQFLGVATVVVYAGAILVTFLFVLMLAQPEGQAFYDQLSWAARLSALSGALVVGILALTLSMIFQNPDSARRPVARHEAAVLSKEILADEHMAHLGAQLFSKQLVAVEVAGTLLLVALVGAVAIVSQIKRPGAGGGPNHG